MTSTLLRDMWRGIVYFMAFLCNMCKVDQLVMLISWFSLMCLRFIFCYTPRSISWLKQLKTKVKRKCFLYPSLSCFWSLDPILVYTKHPCFPWNALKFDVHPFPDKTSVFMFMTKYCLSGLAMSLPSLFLFCLFLLLTGYLDVHH